MIGRRLGVYQVGSLLGSGGMGDVYRAHDTRLGRDVAIKVLPNAFAGDADRLARFERESRVLASLNHPHIAAIYGVEESDGVRALVLELVDGPTLAERIAAGPIPFDEALPIARQIVDALDAAHEHGIVHRDLKPANIKLRADGTVKVLDFGLAKALDPDPAGAELTNSPTLIHAGTRANVILGTAAYMAPEQAKGAPIDRRADVWAFGCVLFEMLSGAKAFKGDDVTDTLASVLRDEPEWSALPPATPEPIRRLLRRALIKSRRDRLADLSAVRLEIGDAMTADRPAPAIAAQRTFSQQRIALAAAAAAVVVLAAIGGYRLRSPAPDRPMSFSILPPEGATFVSTDLGGAPTLSPDGRRVAFVAAGTFGRSLWVQSVDAFDARPVAGTEGASSPFWSPDGASLGFLTGATINRVSLAGGPPQKLAAAQGASSVGALAGTWHPDGRILFYRGNRLFAVPSAGGDAIAITERNIAVFDENLFGPDLLPDGRHYLLLVRGGAELQLQVCVGELGSNERRVLLANVSNARFAPARGGRPAQMLFVRDGRLMAQPFDLDRLALTGTALPVADGVAVSGGGGLGDFTVSASGVLAFRRGVRGTRELAWFDRSGRQIGAIGDRPGSPRNNVRLSPDGARVAFTRQGEGVQDVWVAALTDGAASRFSLNGGRSPAWSPDGRYIAYLRGDTIYRKPADGQGAEQPLWSAPGILSLNDWSGDGRYLLLTRWDPKAGMNGRGIWLLSNPLDDSAKREAVFLESSGLHGQFVPEIGAPRWVSYDASDGTTGQIFVTTMPGAAPGRWQVSTDGGNGSRWRRDGRELFFPSAEYSSMMAVDVDPGPAFHASAPRTLFPLPRALSIAVGQYAVGYDVTSDGQRFLTTLPSPDTPPTAINVVINWQATLAK